MVSSWTRPGSRTTRAWRCGRRWCDWAQIQERDGAADQAVKTDEKAVAENPLFAPATRQLALLYGQRSTDDPKAYELVTKARQAYPNDPEIAKTLGILSYRRGYYPQSVELLKAAARTRKDDAEFLYYLGEDYNQLKQWNEKNPSGFRHMVLLVAAEHARMRNKPWKAARLYERGIRRAKKDGWCRHEVRLCLFTLGLLTDTLVMLGTRT